MNIVVLSGKGGTGKTTVSVNLASVAEKNTALLDCDVEEPNSHLFIKRTIDVSSEVVTGFPFIDEEKCIHCGKCGKFCNFNVILNTKKTNIIMKELCHDCGGCKIVCPVDAITYKNRGIGFIREGKTLRDQSFIDGILNTGEFATTGVIKSVLNVKTNAVHRIIDAPPGTACAAVETVEGADYAVIVTEPTPFALSDMKMVVEMLENMQIPKAVFINKSGSDESELLEFCRSKHIKIIGRLPFTKKYGERYAEGDILGDIFPEVKEIFKQLWKDILNVY